LSAFFRQKYSWLTVGAIAGSAPVLAKLDFGEYDQTVKKVLAETQSGCDNIVSAAFAEIVSIGKNPDGISKLEGLFNTCPQPTEVSLVDITNAIGGLVQGTVQGNNPDAGFPARGLCSMISTEEATPLEALIKYVQSQQNGACVDVNSVGDILAPGAGRSWTWQTCIEYGFFQTDMTSNIFGGSIDLDFYLNICQKAFPGIGIPFPAIPMTNYRFGGLNQEQSSWIMFSNGLQDPWGSNLGINTPLGPNLRVSLSTSAHCAAYHHPNQNDPANLIQSRIEIKQFVVDALSR